MLLQSPVLLLAADTRQETTTTLLLNETGKNLGVRRRYPPVLNECCQLQKYLRM
jgi:hypothetical protein